MASRRKHPELLLSIEDVTPDLAKEWLESNTHNRRASERLVHIYAETMAAGDWALNGEPIIFDRTGKLQSGQHRLLAVIESGTTIRTVVVRNAEPESLFSLDAGRRRRLSDVLTLRGEVDVMNLATAVSWLWRWQEGLMDRTGDTPTHTHMLRLLDATPEIHDALIWGRKVKTSLNVSAGLMAAIFHGLSEIDPVDAETFFEKLVNGEGLVSGDPAFAWRRWMIRGRSLPRGSRPTSSNIAAITVKAWNAYREHRQVSTLVWKAGEQFPEAV